MIGGKDDEDMKSINSVYTEDYCRALELSYGYGMLSEGGTKALALMFEHTNLKGKKVLDFGSGLGGAAIYIADHHDAQVTGIEINPSMIETARSRIPAHLNDQVNFVCVTNWDLPFENDQFDVICSIGVLVHLTAQQKLQTFKEFYRILKKQGMLVIRDWLGPDNEIWGDRVNQLIETEHLSLYACSPQHYVKLLEQAGFSKVTLTDHSEIFASFNDDIVSHLESTEIKQKFIDDFGKNTWEEHISGYKNVAQAHRTGEIIGGLLRAVKKAP